MKNKKTIILSGVLASTVLASTVTAITLPVTLNSSSFSSNANLDGVPNVKRTDNVNFLDDKLNTNNRFTSLNVYEEKIVAENVNRNLNSNVYSTSLMETWKANNEFSSRNHNGYPAYDFNWKIIREYGNSVFQDLTKKYYDQVINEKVKDWQFTDDKGKQHEVKYNDYRFIRDEIKNKKLKKHPAADGMHNPDLFVK